MKIQCNDIDVQIVATCLHEALQELGYAGATVATALNGEFVPKSMRAEVEVREGDRIDVLAPMQGG